MTTDTANRGRSVTLYRCIPPTACLPGNESYPNGLCMPGAYGPLCGICNETDGYAKSKDGCRRCDEHGTKQSTTEIAVWTGVMGVPIFLTFWYFFALRPLVTRGVDEEEEEDRPEDSSAAWSRFKARMFFCLGRASEHPIWLKTMAPVIGPAQTLIFNCVAYVVKNNPKVCEGWEGERSAECRLWGVKIPGLSVSLKGVWSVEGVCVWCGMSVCVVECGVRSRAAPPCV